MVAAWAEMRRGRATASGHGILHRRDAPAAAHMGTCLGLCELSRVVARLGRAGIGLPRTVLVKNRDGRVWSEDDGGRVAVAGVNTFVLHREVVAVAAGPVRARAAKKWSKEGD